MKSILYGVTTDVSLVFYTGHAKALKAAGFETAFVTAPGAFSQQFAHSEGVTVFAVPMRRQPSIVSDLCAFLKLVGVIRKVRPDLTNFGTPKAGLLGNLAAFFCRVPHRIYTLHGLRLETATGWNRWMLAICERHVERNRDRTLFPPPDECGALRTDSEDCQFVPRCSCIGFRRTAYAR